ncbi:MAG: GNAT family N-acetyltransferase [Clostridia bacterium]|nr:GNAT family N-acetyltransferase [Clostridia bacterium]
MTEEEYIIDPCRASSLPFWKTEEIKVPEHLLIVRDDLMPDTETEGEDEPYFRMIHDLDNVRRSPIPEGFVIAERGIPAFAEHINECYSDIGVKAEELSAYARRPVCDPALWVAVVEEKSGRIAASGIAELDARIGEGILEWIQVSPEHRRKGLGRFVVNELLCRMLGRAKFVTVSGRLLDPSKPEALYASCGFAGKTVWHVITKKPPDRNQKAAQ